MFKRPWNKMSKIVETPNYLNVYPSCVLFHIRGFACGRTSSSVVSRPSSVRPRPSSVVGSSVIRPSASVVCPSARRPSSVCPLSVVRSSSVRPPVVFRSSVVSARERNALVSLDEHFVWRLPGHFQTHGIQNSKPQQHFYQRSLGCLRATGNHHSELKRKGLKARREA